jgi:hypothetical protein
MSNHEEEYEETALQLLITLMDQPQALSLRHLLDDQNIPTVVKGGHAAAINGCQPYQFYVDEDYFDPAKEVIDSYSQPTLLTGEIEGELSRLSKELNRLEANAQAKPHVEPLRASITKLQSQLNALNKELD